MTNKYNYILKGFVTDDKFKKQYCILYKHGEKFQATYEEVCNYVMNGNEIEHCIIEDYDIKIDTSYKKFDYTGKQVNNWQVIEFYGNINKSSTDYWLCKCLKCGTMRLESETMLTHRDHQRCSNCRSLAAKAKAQAKPPLKIKTSTEARTGRKTYINEFSDWLSQFIRQHYDVKVIQGACNIIKGYKFDIYLPDRKIAINCNKTYIQDKEYNNAFYNINVTKECIKHNIRLISIFEYEWQHTKDKIEQYLLHELGLDQKALYIGKCEARKVDNVTAMDFCEAYNLNGSTAFSLSIGLYHNNELVELLAFGEPKRTQFNGLELLRHCVKTGYFINNGINKLFEQFKKIMPNTNVVTYIDMLKFTSKDYEQLSFKYQCTLEPDYVYVGHDRVYTRNQCQKEKLVKQGFDENLSETQIMTQRGFTKVFNKCEAVYIYKA